MEKLLELLRSSLQANLEQLHPTDRPHAQRRLGEALEEAGAYLAEVTGRLKLLDEKLQRSQQADINRNTSQRLTALEFRTNLVNESLISLGLSLQATGQRTRGLDDPCATLENPAALPSCGHGTGCLCNDCRGGRRKVW